MKFFIIIHKVKRIVDNLLPLPIRRVARKLYRWFAEKLVFLIYSRDELWFPPWLDSDTNTINKLVGDKLVSFLVEFAGLKANEKILEVGCGFGRIAAPLTKYLTSAGTYEGFDIIEDHINWCKEKITMKFPNFNFKLVDLHNENYNPSGTFRATDFRFPYDDGYFDFVILNSVFTIMDPQDMSPYASEIVRVLRKGGRCTATFFLLTDESTEFIDKNLSNFDFRYKFGHYRTINREVPRGAFAYEESFIRELLKTRGLNIVEPIYYGCWYGKENPYDYQDIVLAVSNGS